MKNGFQIRFAKGIENKYRHSRLKYLLGTEPERIRGDVCEYITAHELAGFCFDSECQEITYDENMVLVLHKEGGFWLIIDVIFTPSVLAFYPVFVWQRIQRDLWYILVQAIAAWRTVRKTSCAIH